MNAASAWLVAQLTSFSPPLQRLYLLEGTLRPVAYLGKLRPDWILVNAATKVALAPV